MNSVLAGTAIILSCYGMVWGPYRPGTRMSQSGKHRCAEGSPPGPFPGPPPLSVPGDLTGFSGHRFTRPREGRDLSAACHQAINLLRIQKWGQAIQSPSPSTQSKHMAWPKEQLLTFEQSRSDLWALKNKQGGSWHYKQRGDRMSSANLRFTFYVPTTLQECMLKCISLYKSEFYWYFLDPLHKDSSHLYISRRHHLSSNS